MLWGVFGVFANIARVIDLFDVVVCFFDGVNDEASERERDEHHDPAGEEFVQVWGLGGIHAKGTSGTGGLNGLVDACEAGNGEWVVAESSHDPVNESLIASITEVI